MLIKAAQHDHVVLGHDPVPAQPTCISRKCPEHSLLNVSVCWHRLHQDKQFGFVTGTCVLSRTIICDQSYQTKPFLFQLISTMERG